MTTWFYLRGLVFEKEDLDSYHMCVPGDLYCRTGGICCGGRGEGRDHRGGAY